MKNRFGLLSLVVLALMGISMVGCSSEPADESATPPASSEPGTGKLKASSDTAGASASPAATASPFRHTK